ncbi:MAG: hypothetical protein KAW12_29105 [Candidatus Aminicenantes bacterium]|nr:hypothetical protein [Candidatus Aminicenantes bacterium]
MKIEVGYKETPDGKLPYSVKLTHEIDEKRKTLATPTVDVIEYFTGKLKKLVKQYGRADEVEIIGDAPLLRENKEFMEFLENEILEVKG